MSVIRVEKSKNYTIMSNAHLRDKELSLKAKGLLSVVLSLPDNWDYSLSGLSSICKESITAIRSAINELRDMGYTKVEKLYPDKSVGRKQIEYSYIFFESKQDIACQGIENLHVDNLHIEDGMQINTDILSTDKLNTEEKNTDHNASTVVEENYKAFFSEKEKKILELPPLPYEYQQEEFDKFIYVKIYNIILQIPGVNSEDLEKAGAITEIISYFHKKYLERTGERHPIMKDSVYESIVRKMLNPIDAIIGLDVFMDVDSYKRMIDRFFSTQYGKKSGNIIDYRIGYFFGDKVLERLCYRECQ